jgi:hypothetical protein
MEGVARWQFMMQLLVAPAQAFYNPLGRAAVIDHDLSFRFIKILRFVPNTFCKSFYFLDTPF